MTGLEKNARLIPDEYRKEIIELDLVNKAKAQTTDGTMNYLGVIWKNYIDPGYELTCNSCCDKVLKAFRLMLPIFINIEKENRLLKAV